MLLKNTHAILCLGFLVGIATNLGLIGSQSYLLSHADAVYMLYAGIISGVIFSLFLKFFRTGGFKFAKIAIALIFIYLVLNGFLLAGIFTEFQNAVLWCLVAYLGFDLMRWIVSEILQRHLDPARSQTYYSYLNSFFEVGTILVVMVTKIYGIVLSPEDTLKLIAIFCLAGAVLILLQFVHRKNFEVTFSSHVEDAPQVDGSVFKKLVFCFLFLSVLYAVVELSIDYLVHINIKATLKNYDSIREVTENYFAVSCLLVIFFSFLMGWVIDKKRLSPLLLYGVYSLVLFGMAILCLMHPFLFGYVAFEVIRRLTEYILYNPANHLVFSSFVPQMRQKIKVPHVIIYYSIIPIVMAGVFSLSKHWPIAGESYFLTVLILAALGLTFVGLFRFSVLYRRILYQLLEAGGKTASIIAANVLSYLRPVDYVSRMRDILAASPKKLLKKTVILGLGFSKKDDAVEIIKEQFLSDKEEIQIAVLDALGVSRRFQATQFMLNILLEKTKPKTHRVRLNAMMLVAGIYGENAIPFLLNGLDDPEPRIVANALEVLSYFRRSELIPYFLKHADSNVPRVKANALLGLAQFRSTRKVYYDLVRKALAQGDFAMKASVLYTIGKLRDRRLRTEVIKICEDAVAGRNVQILNSLTWALIRLNDKRGTESAARLIISPEENSVYRDFMHFFAQYPQSLRYDVLTHLIKMPEVDAQTISLVGKRLKESIYDFHEELEYLNVYAEAAGKSS